MTAEELRKKPLELVNKIAHASREDQVTSIISCACFEMFAEIAAQLIELNENIKLLAPKPVCWRCDGSGWICIHCDQSLTQCQCPDDGSRNPGTCDRCWAPPQPAPPPHKNDYEEETEEIREQKRKHAELLAQPVSDPEKFVRCSDCAKEIERPSWLEVGKNTIICDSCIPF